VAAEAEPGAEGEAEEPVGREVAEHGCARVAGATESTGGGGLDAVEKLESGTGGKQGDSGVDDTFVGGVEARDVARENEQNDAHGGHEGGAENDGGVARIARGFRIAATEGLTDTDGSGRGEPEGNHVGKGDGVERDLVAGLRDGAETRDESCDRSEDRDFGGELESGREAENDELADAGEIRLDGRFEQVSFVMRVVPEKVDHEDKGEIGTGDAGRDARTGDAEGREAKIAEDK